MRLIKYISDLHIERKIKTIRFNKKDLGGNIFNNDIRQQIKNVKCD